MSLASISWEDLSRGAQILARMQFQADEERPKLPALLRAIRDAIKDAQEKQKALSPSSFSDPILAANEPAKRLVEEARRVTVDLYGEEYAEDLFRRLAE